jgi:hypothetical protein
MRVYIRRKYQPLLLIITIIFLGIYLYSHYQQRSKAAPESISPTPTVQPQITQPASSSASLRQRTKTTNCVIINAVQDKDCTPGAVFSDVTKEQICTPGYSKTVRNVPESEKKAVYAEYGIDIHSPGEFEVDHLISLELGGSNDIANLWPEAADPRPGFHEKDKVENYLHKQVCDGIISLQEAQEEIANQWLQVYTQLPNQ